MVNPLNNRLSNCDMSHNRSMVSVRNGSDYVVTVVSYFMDCGNSMVNNRYGMMMSYLVD